MAHIHEKIDFTTSVYVVYKNKVLLHLHDKLNIWLPPGGHIELDEDPPHAAVREVKEETGLDVELWSGNQLSHYADTRFTDLVPPMFLNRHFFNETHEHVDLVYFAASDSDAAVPEKPDGKVVWAGREDLHTMDLPDNVRFYAATALDTLGEK